jgi:GntR family transcriptional regulator/MocR family aminotransferase
MLPWKSLIPLNSDSPLAIYLQIANAVIAAIKQGIIKPGERIPGTRDLSLLLGVHRQTVVNAYDELNAQGWIYSLPSKGNFVSEHLPEISPRKLNAVAINSIPVQTGFKFIERSFIRTPSIPLREMSGFHDGPDPRIAPLKQLATAYRRVLNRKSGLHNFSYVQEKGKAELRKVLSEHLNTSRGMQTTPESIFISRGSQMAVYLVSQIILSKGDLVIVGDTNYYYTDRVFINSGATLIRVSVDHHGIDVDAIEKLCRKKKDQGGECNVSPSLPYYRHTECGTKDETAFTCLSIWIHHH